MNADNATLGLRIEPAAIYTAAEAAALVKMNPYTLRKKLRCGIVKGRNRGQWRILGSELLKLA